MVVSSVSVELNAVLFFIFYRVRSSGTHIISVRSDMYSVDLG